MPNFQIKLDINTRMQIRIAFRAIGADHSELLDRLQHPLVWVNQEEVEFIQKTLEKALSQENNWTQQQLYRETYGKVRASASGANAKENAFDRNCAFPNQPSQANGSH